MSFKFYLNICFAWTYSKISYLIFIYVLLYLFIYLLCNLSAYISIFWDTIWYINNASYSAYNWVLRTEFSSGTTQFCSQLRCSFILGMNEHQSCWTVLEIELHHFLPLVCLLKAVIVIVVRHLCFIIWFVNNMNNLWHSVIKQNM